MASYVQSTLASGENILFTARLSLWGFVFQITFGVLMVIGGTFSEGHGALVFGLALLGYVALRFVTTELVITDRRIVAKTGIISRQTLELSLGRVESVRVLQGIIGRLLDFGTVVISGTGATHEAFPKIVDPLGFRRVFAEIHETSL